MMNVEIWKNLPSHSKLADLRHQQIQQTMSYGLICVSNIVNLVASKSAEMLKEITRQVLKLTIVSANLIGDQLQEINSKRRLEVKRYLNSEYGSICSSQVKNSEWLFGNDLNESLKASKVSSSVMKQTMAKPSRYRPYNILRPSGIYAP